MARSVPKELYLYWHQGWRNAPDIVKRCAETWTTRNPSWTVNFFDKDNIEEMITIPPVMRALNLPLPALSDVIRLLLLKQGGVWADSTAWCARPLDDWLEPLCQRAGFFAYSKPKMGYPINSWFIAAAPESRIISLWYDMAYCLAIKTKYCLDLRALGLACEDLCSWLIPQLKGLSMPTSDQIEDENYFWVHKLFQICLDNDDEFRTLWRLMPEIDHEPTHIYQRLGLLSPVTEDALARIDNAKAHVYKLTRREVIPSNVSGTVLDILFSSLPAAPHSHN